MYNFYRFLMTISSLILLFIIALTPWINILIFILIGWEVKKFADDTIVLQYWMICFFVFVIQFIIFLMLFL